MHRIRVPTPMPSSPSRRKASRASYVRIAMKTSAKYRVMRCRFWMSMSFVSPLYLRFWASGPTAQPGGDPAKAR
jgi:hypothetical protein